MIAILFSILAILGSGRNNIKIESAWIRPAYEKMNSAMYFKIVNNSGKADTLFKVTSSLADLVQIHETFRKNGLIGMREVKFIPIPPHSSVTFEPGGYHVMFIQLKKNLKLNTKGEAFLFFKYAGKIKINPVVKTP